MPIRETFFLKPTGPRRGDVALVRPTASLTDPIPNAVTHPGQGFYVIKVRDIPDPNNRIFFRRRFAGGQITGVVLNPDVDGIGVNEIMNKREWFVAISEMPGGWRNTLETTGEISRTWTAIKPYLRKKKVKIPDTNIYSEPESDAAVDTDASSA